MGTIQKWSGCEARALREALRMSVRGFAARLGVGERTITKWEAGGSQVCPRPEMQALLDTALLRADDAARQRFESAVGALRSSPTAAASPVEDDPALPQAMLHRAERLRRGLTDALTEGAMTMANIEDWERAVLDHGVATRDCPAGALLVDLTTDLADLQRALARRWPSSSLRRLTRVTAQMAGLMCLTLIKLDERTAFRRWARTARVAAKEADDPEVRSWVRAHEAYGHYYGGNLVDAVAVAQHAQALAGLEESHVSAWRWPPRWRPVLRPALGGGRRRRSPSAGPKRFLAV
jgi:transcriptional regulator with XRE-family HTH domain